MTHVVSKGLRIAVLGGLLAVTGAANALTITFTTTDLTDTISGQDLRRYSYLLNGAMSQFDNFKLSFDAADYGTLSNPTPSTSLQLQVQPLIQPNAPTAGTFGVALIGPGTTFVNRPVAIDFVWKGTGAPGAQAFQVFSQGGTLLQSGVTQALAVPEPGTYALMTGGLLMLAMLSYRERHRPAHRSI